MKNNWHRMGVGICVGVALGLSSLTIDYNIRGDNSFLDRISQYMQERNQIKLDNYERKRIETIKYYDNLENVMNSIPQNFQPNKIFEERKGYGYWGRRSEYYKFSFSFEDVDYELIFQDSGKQGYDINDTVTNLRIPTASNDLLRLNFGNESYDLSGRGFQTRGDVAYRPQYEWIREIVEKISEDINLLKQDKEI